MADDAAHFSADIVVQDSVVGGGVVVHGGALGDFSAEEGDEVLKVKAEADF